MTEFNLSERRLGEFEHLYREKDVKEFIKRLKKELKKREYWYTDDESQTKHLNPIRVNIVINKLAGPKLTI